MLYVLRVQHTLLNELLMAPSSGSPLSNRCDEASCRSASSRVGPKLVPQYLKDITQQEVLDLKYAANENQRLSRVKGSGRPSKKERRDLKDFFDDDA